MKLSIYEFMQHAGRRVDRTLDALLPAPRGASARLSEAMRYSVFNGGKRIRPVLVYAGAVTLNPTLIENFSHADASMTDLDRVACAIECIHAYSLVHDDLPAMDDDALRRGKPTCHIAFDEATAILAGDALQTLAFEQLSQLQDTPAQTIVQLVNDLATAAGSAGMVSGQAIDLAAVNQPRTITALEEMHNQKTGALINCSVMMGARVQGTVDERTLSLLSEFAQTLGLAFQVQDDILDVTSDTQTLGKQQGADEALNKPTYVSLLGLNKAQKKAKELQQQAYHLLDTIDEDTCYLRELMNFVIERSH